MDFSSYYNRVHVLGVSWMSQPAALWPWSPFGAALHLGGSHAGNDASSVMSPCPSLQGCTGSNACRASLSRGSLATSPKLPPFSLQEPFPHLFDQMFARLQLLGAVRDVFHSALATLHLPPLSQI